MNKQLNVPFKIFASVVLLFVVGCVSTSTPSLQGTWVTTITEADSVSAGEGGLYLGQWEIVFADSGRQTALLNGQKVVEGPYTFTQEQVVVTAESGPYKCTGHETGTYKWSVEKDSLTLTPIDDKCSARRMVFGLHPLSKKK